MHTTNHFAAVPAVRHAPAHGGEAKHAKLEERGAKMTERGNMVVDME